LIQTRHYKLLTALAAIVATALPALWFTSWLQRQGEAEVSVTATWSVGVIDLSIDRAVATLNDLAAHGVDSWRPANLDLLRQAVFAAGPVKEVAVIGANGQTLCTDAGATFPRRDVIAFAPTLSPQIVLDVLSVTDRGERLLRVRRVARAGEATLAASVPIDLLLPQVGGEGSAFSGHARLTLPDGTLVGTAGSVAATSDAKRGPFFHA
jgi:hypothetical protein